MLKVKTPKTGKARRELKKRAPKLVSSQILYFRTGSLFVYRESYCWKNNPENRNLFFFEMICLSILFSSTLRPMETKPLVQKAYLFVTVFILFGNSTFGFHLFYASLQEENGKKTLILHGTKTSNVLNSVLTQIYHLKKDSAVKYSRKNADIRPFESGGETSLEFFSLKTDCSIFVVSTKLRFHAHFYANV